MSWDEFKKIDEALSAFNLKEVVFTGGEPTLWPHLVDAIALSYKLGKIRVVTNGLGRDIDDYGKANIIQVSDYGAINRMDYYRLKKQGKRRVKIQTSVHWDWDRSQVSDLPGKCGCVGYSFVKDQVWPCAMAAVMNTDSGIPISQINKMDVSNVHRQDLCRSCLVNRKNRKAPKPVVQLSIWENKSIILG